MRIQRKNRDDKYVNVIELANTTITVTRNFVWIILTILGIGIAIITFFGYNTINEIKNDYYVKITEKISYLEKKTELTNKIYDTLQVKYASIKEKESELLNLKAQFNDLSNKYDYALKRLNTIKSQYDSLEHIQSKFTENMLSFEDNFNQKTENLNKELIELSGIFNKVGVINQNIFSPHQKLILYLLADEVDKIKPTEEQDPSIKFNIGVMLQNIGEYASALSYFEQVKPYEDKLVPWAKKKLDKFIAECRSDSSSMLVNELNEKNSTCEQICFLLYRNGYLSYKDINLISNATEKLKKKIRK